jgi:hypothetical protein
MSELKVDKVSPRSGTYVSLNTVGSKNIFINGDMSIAQRSTSVASVATGYNTCDRWNTVQTSLGAFTQSQSTDVPTGQGFATSLKMDCTTADASPAVADRLFIEQKFEGQNLQYLKKGTANAVSTTLSFWVKSIKTGTYITQLYDVDNDRSISKSYTVDVTDTWEKKTITFDGDTTGTLGNDNSNDLSARFYLGVGTNYSSGTLGTSWAANVNANVAVGQVNIADSTSNDFYITGVQLEAGTTASDFEFLPFDVNYSRCNRYYQDYTEGNTIIRGYGYNTSAGMDTPFTFKTPMRAAPTMTEVSGTDGGSNTTLTNFGAIKTYGCDFNTDPTTSNQTNFYSFKFTADAEL